MNKEIYIYTISTAKQMIQQAQEENDIQLVQRLTSALHDLELQYMIFVSATTKEEL